MKSDYYGMAYKFVTLWTSFIAIVDSTIAVYRGDNQMGLIMSTLSLIAIGIYWGIQRIETLLSERFPKVEPVADPSPVESVCR